MKNLIILLAGEARAGKDTSADSIQAILDTHFITHNRSFFAKALKESAKHVFNLTDEHVFGSLKETDFTMSVNFDDIYVKTYDELTKGHLSHIPEHMKDKVTEEIAFNITTAMVKCIMAKGKSLTGSTSLRDNNQYIVSPRQLMQWWGTEAVRVGAYEDAWIDAVQSEIDKSEGDVFIISDTRFDNEAEQIIKKNLSANVLCIRVHRGEKVQVSKHASEAGISDKYVDYDIQNNGSIADLMDSLHNILFQRNCAGDLKWLAN